MGSDFDVFSYFSENTVKYHLGAIGANIAQKNHNNGYEFANSSRFIELAESKLSERNVGLNREVGELKAKSEMLERLAVEDPLTGLLNRRGYDNAMKREVGRGDRASYGLEDGVSGYDFGLIALDIDHFKNFNDTYGHLAGDEVLKKVAGVFSYVANRDMDIVTRPGGEEFSVILPGTGYDGTLKVAKAINERVAGTVMTFRDDDGKMHERAVNVSAGVVSYRAGDSPESITKRADDRLYLAKGKGRNCVVGR